MKFNIVYNTVCNFIQTSVRESDKAGTLVLSVSAVDDDCRLTPCVNYNLEPAGSGFEIDSRNGIAHWQSIIRKSYFLNFVHFVSKQICSVPNLN